MKIIKIQTRHEQVTTDVLCDRCSSSMLSSVGNIEGLQHVMRGGYGSYLGDGVEYDLDACERCLDEWFKSFKTLRVTQK